VEQYCGFLRGGLIAFACLCLSGVAQAQTPSDVAPATPSAPSDVAQPATPSDVAQAPTPTDVAQAPTPSDVAQAPTPTDAAVRAPIAPIAPPPEPRSLWRPSWPQFSRVEGVTTIAAGVATGALLLIGQQRPAHWQGGVLFDDAVRRNLRLDSASDRRTVRDLGDLPYFAAPLLPMLIDPLIASWLVRGDTKAALNLELVAIEAFSYSGLASFVAVRTARRERPDSSECWRLHPDGKGCPLDTESFFSGHTAIASTSAGLVCANHTRMALWGNPIADGAACALGTTAALASGISRIAADRHYATDVLTGFGIGFGVRYAVPVLLHYSRSHANVALSLTPGAPCTGACLRLSGSF
jgi:membrane-associated phospholipid phosphatase